MLGQLGRFQQQTETIRQRLAGGGDGDGRPGVPPPSPIAFFLSQPRGRAVEGRGSALLLEGATPLRQHPTGLRGSGHTPGLLARPPSQLFDGLPPSPAALASASAWHASVGQPQQQPQPQLQPQAPPPAGASKQPRSPIGPDVRHTKKSLAAAAAAAT